MLALVGVVVGEERDAGFVHALAQHRAGDRPSPIVHGADDHGVRLGDVRVAGRRPTTCAARRPSRRRASRRRDPGCRPSPPIRTPPASAPGSRRRRPRSSLPPSEILPGSLRSCPPRSRRRRYARGSCRRYRPVENSAGRWCKNRRHDWHARCARRLRRGPRRRHRLHHRDRGTRQGRRCASVPRRRHRGPGHPARHVRRRVGPSRRRQVRPRAAARRTLPAAHPQRRRPGRRAGGPGHARADLGLSTDPRHRRRDRARPTGPRVGDGPVVRGTVRPRHPPTRRTAAHHRRMRNRDRAFHDPMAG